MKVRMGVSSQSLRSAKPPKSRSHYGPLASSQSARGSVTIGTIDEGVPSTRKRTKLQNLDGTELTVKDYQRVVWNMQHGVDDVGIANFGFANS